jgi:putative membrane protein
VSEPDRRRPRSVFGVGEEPDARFTLANERTFLAWVRTSLALVAAGVAVEAFLDDLPPAPRAVAALALIAVGVVAAAAAYRRWAAAERALRLGRPLPAPALAPWLGYGIAVGGVVLVALALLT